MQEAKTLLLFRSELLPIILRAIEKRKGAIHVGSNEFLRTENRSIHMAFGGKVHNRKWPMLTKKAGHEFTIANIATNKSMSRGGLQRFEVLQIPRVSKFIEINDVVARFSNCLQHEIAADESGTAGDQNAIRPEDS